jgi:HEAT repeat protein
LSNLLAASSVERLVELSLQKQTDVTIGRTLAALARLAAGQTAEVVFRLLESETAATNRSRLIRLAGQLGSSGLEAARERLMDERWYVVRNACNILGTLGDPELAAQLRAPLRHPDPRVQEAAFAALSRSKAPGRAELMAAALPHLPTHLQELVLNELLLAKDPATVSLLQDFALRATESKQGMRERAVQVLATMPQESSVEALGRVLYDTSQTLLLRRAALGALRGSASPLARERLAVFAQTAPSDPLAKECQMPARPEQR